MTSFKLCGGIFVAYPAAIPVIPLTNKFGKRAGSTVGSIFSSEKLGAHSTVSLSISCSKKSLILAKRASV